MRVGNNSPLSQPSSLTLNSRLHTLNLFPMLAIVLGYTAPGSTSPVEILYTGRSASEALAIADAPPAGFLRTEMLKNPVTHHRRHFPGNVAPIVDVVPVVEPELAADFGPAPAKDSRRK